VSTLFLSNIPSFRRGLSGRSPLADKRKKEGGRRGKFFFPLLILCRTGDDQSSRRADRGGKKKRGERNELAPSCRSVYLLFPALLVDSWR